MSSTIFLDALKKYKLEQVWLRNRFVRCRLTQACSPFSIILGNLFPSRLYHIVLTDCDLASD